MATCAWEGLCTVSEFISVVLIITARDLTIFDQIIILISSQFLITIYRFVVLCLNIYHEHFNMHIVTNQPTIYSNKTHHTTINKLTV